MLPKETDPSQILQNKINKLNEDHRKIAEKRAALLMSLSKLNQKVTRINSETSRLLSRLNRIKNKGIVTTFLLPTKKGETHEIRIKEPEFPEKIVSILNAHKIFSIKDLLKYTEAEILALPNSSKKTLDFIKKNLLVYGFALREQTK